MVMEERKELKTFRVKLLCDCGGEMKVVKTLMSDPPQYQHTCVRCEKEVTMDRSYPCIEQEEVTQ